jgi:hypothetical protein
MWTGDKVVEVDAPPSRDDVKSRLMAALLLLVCSAFIAWIASLGG